MRDGIILLVEDNPDDEALTLRALKQHKIKNEVVVAADGALALDYLLGTGAYAGQPAPPLPQLVLLDLNLPKIDGIKVLQRIRAEERTKMLPVVILTSSNEQRDLIAGYSNHCNSYVRKPVDFDEFVGAVQNLGLYWLILNEAPPQPK